MARELSKTFDLIFYDLRDFWRVGDKAPKADELKHCDGEYRTLTSALNHQNKGDKINRIYCACGKVVEVNEISAEERTAWMKGEVFITKPKNNLAYIASPYASVLKTLGDENGRKVALIYARFGAKWARENGYVPISPVLNFDGIYSENEREKIMESCMAILESCGVIVVVDCPYTPESEGINIEVVRAKVWGLEIKRAEFLRDCERNSSWGNQFAQSSHPASLRRTPSAAHSQGVSVAQSTTANTRICKKKLREA